MYYTYFEIRNFKGIDHTKLEMARPPRSRVNTLVGLNESGKTTVLDAINLLTYRENLLALEMPGYATPDVHDLIPIAKRSNFNDSISIEVGIALDDRDQADIKNRLNKAHGITLTSPIEPFSIKQSYRFKSSRVEPGQPRTMWTMKPRGRMPNKRTSKVLTDQQWQQAHAIVKDFLPRIIYFPNFMFEFPDKIFLEKPPSEPQKHAFYKAVLQDVLDAVGENTNLDQHILARLKSNAPFEKRNLESVLLKMGAHITRSVFSNWDRIFHRPSQGKEIVVTADTDVRGAAYLHLRLKQNNEYYEISERSLGFRWFFAYLLLTQYRGFRKGGSGNVLFLLDEPASNLHPSAQAQLLDSLSSLPPGCHLVYTTHSHHMINPDWLEGAYVVKNEGIDYTAADDDYSARRTMISLHKYREFASQHPNQSTYFQPILDVLNYAPARLENVPAVIMLEGKNDFYTIRFLQQLLQRTEGNLMPGGGAGSLFAPIQLYLAWGRNFIILLDSDAEGKNQRARYLQEFGPILDGRIITLEDVDPAWKGKSMESLFDPTDQLAIQHACYPQTESFNKTHFNRAIQELMVTKKSVQLSETTLAAVRKLYDGMIHKLEAAKGIG